MAQTSPRRRRLPDAVTEQRMLDVALSRIAERGLHVTFDDLGFEDLIVDADVSRSTVYRKWPSKTDFYRRLLVEIVRQPVAMLHHVSPEHLQQLAGAVTKDAGWLDSPASRRAMLVELSRVGTAENFRAVFESPANHTHTALAAVIGSTEGELREEAIRTLRISEAQFVERMAEFYTAVLAMAGLRLLPGVTMPHFVVLAMGLVQGLVNHAHGMPPHLLAEVTADPFGVGQEQSWTTAALGLTALVLGITETDDDADPVAAVRSFTDLTEPAAS